MVMQTFVFSFDNVKLTSNLDLQLELRVTIAGYYCSDYWGVVCLCSATRLWDRRLQHMWVERQTCEYLVPM
jgi:hypothetical protein